MKKKLGIAVGLLSTVFILTSCGSSPQDEFVKYMENQSKQTEGTYDFNFGIKELELAETPDMAGNPVYGMLVTQLKDISLTGTMKSNTKDSAFAMDMKINALGMEVPFNMMGNFGKEPKMYMATDIMEYIMNIVSSMTGEDMTAGADFSQLKGKYIDIFEMDDAMDQAELADALKDMKNAEANQKEINKKFTDFIKGLDKKSFTKKDNVLSHTFTKDEFKDLMKVMSDETETELSTEELKEMFEIFDKFSAKLDIDTKTDKTSMILDLAPSAEEAEEAGFKSIKFLFETTMTDKKADIKLPEAKDIISSEELETLFPEDSLDGMDMEVSDEDFNDIKEGLADAKDDIDPEMAKELLEVYKPMITEEQYKELEAILK